jgi:hypothetical protein
MTETSTGRRLDAYNSIDSSSTQAQMDAINASLARAPEQLNYLSDLLGPYPFDSIGAVADRAARVGYALEVQTKPHYSGGFSTGNPSINMVTQLHEIAHMWVGNSVSPQSWHEIWVSEGWATWLEWLWEFEANGSPDNPADRFDELYNDPEFEWDIAPAVLDNDPANLFNGFATYDRSAMMIEGYRQIVGDRRFYSFLRGLVADFRHTTSASRSSSTRQTTLRGSTAPSWRCLTSTSSSGCSSRSARRSRRTTFRCRGRRGGSPRRPS